MRRTHLVLGILLLLVAAAVAVYTTREPESGEVTTAAPPERRTETRTGSPHPSRIGHLPSAGPNKGRSEFEQIPVLDTLRVEPSRPNVAARAARVERGARIRLEEMIDELSLSAHQQRAIFPILARSHPDYDRSLQLVGVPGNIVLDPLGKLAADREIYHKLDPDQQLDLEIAAASADIWWTDVIGRLEQDLIESTRDPVAAGQAPEPDPPSDEQPTPAAPNPHRGGNLLDRLKEESP